MTQDEIIEMANKAFDESSFTDAEVIRFAKLIEEKEYEKTSAWYRKLIRDIVADIHKFYEKKPFRTRTIRARV